MTGRRHSVLRAAVLTFVLTTSALAQQGAATRAQLREERRAARREAAAARTGLGTSQDTDAPVAERQRAERALRVALGRAVRQRLNLTPDQATRLMDVNRRVGDERLRLTRTELQIRRDLRAAVKAGDSRESAATARLLDQLLDVQKQRVELQQKEQAWLSEFLTPDQRARYVAMMEQLRRRIQARADSARAGALDPEPDPA